MASASAELEPRSASARLDAELLLAAVLDKPRSFLYAWPEHEPESGQVARFLLLLKRRWYGEPLAYLLKRREFWSLTLEVGPEVLIPRPETELLVELALTAIPHDRAPRIADLGTGSGAIALALASERPRAHIIATDISAAALAVARRNADRLEIDNIEFCQGDWTQALTGQSIQRFDMIVSNPPYVAPDSEYLLQGDVRFEPRQALVGGNHGLAAIETIIVQAAPLLAPAGWLLLEHGYDQREAVLRLLHEQGFVEIADYRDSAGIDRVAVASAKQ